MPKLLIAILAISCSAAWAEKVFDDGPISIVFHERPCAQQLAEVAIAIHKPTSEPKAATVTLSGKVLAGCWALDEDGDYIVMDGRGTGGIIFAKAIKEPKGAI